MNHSPEPWNNAGAPCLIYDHAGEVVAKVIKPEDRARIVACVNRCRGIPTTVLNDTPRDENMLRSLTRLLTAIQDTTEEQAACQDHAPYAGGNNESPSSATP